MNDDLRKLINKIDNFENEIAAVRSHARHELEINLEQRDERIKELREEIIVLKTSYGHKNVVAKHYQEYKEHHAKQIDENRKIFKRVSESEKRIEKLEGTLDFTRSLLDAKIHIDEKESNPKKPYKCPICEGKGHCLKCRGKGEWFTGNSPGATALCEYCNGSPNCKACEGKGIVWG